MNPAIIYPSRAGMVVRLVIPKPYAPFGVVITATKIPKNHEITAFELM